MTRRPIFQVVNGDSTLGLLQESTVPGKAVVWPDMLMEGPLRAGPGGEFDWAARARFLAKSESVHRPGFSAQALEQRRGRPAKSRTGNRPAFEVLNPLQARALLTVY